MAKKLSFIILLFTFLLSLTSPAVSSSSNTINPGINFWCDKTPYPETCKHHTNTIYGQKAYGTKRVSDFKKLVVEVAIDQSLKAQNHNKRLGSKCRNKLEKAAWFDCLKLYQDTITLLNQTIDSTTKANDYDVQTWLSTSLTNLETCRTGFVELGVTDFVFPLLFNNNNLTKLISNSLSLKTNASVASETNRYKEGFPSWVTAGDRKLLQSTSPPADVVVAKDGSGDFKTIKEALQAAADRSDGSKRFVIYLKRGTYNEKLDIGNNLKNIMLIGDSMRYVFITGSKSVIGGSTTFDSATVAVTGEGFIARGITFRNTAGPQNHQAVALRSGADLSVFYRCGFEGYQDTLYVHSQRQFYKECYIYGTVDFIFGNAAVVFQNCIILVRKPLDNQKNTVTAQGRTDSNQNTGISIHNSRVTAASDLLPVLNSFQTYLGRPWKQYSRTVFMKTYLDTLVDPAGWLEWDGDFALNTLFYGEYNNIGPKASTSGRVKWLGYHVITSATEASKFTVQNFIAGQSWLPATGVPFTPGL
ncbi:Pectinesterase [Quillaja saponaria]|uniref:Pectinesterase n=1 Tax=Quillaja saponaria TaxID=32244 RepID=A0AAD7LEA5_QUISA|nr:Pectinesterase [Quillaja saponaria]